MDGAIARFASEVLPPVFQTRPTVFARQDARDGFGSRLVRLAPVTITYRGLVRAIVLTSCLAACRPYFSRS